MAAMTQLSVNINKVALIRNSRGRDFPSVVEFAQRCLELGAHGITLHPRPDQRHARYRDVTDLKPLCDRCGRELNVEGNPTPEFLDVVERAKPAQCTLVPDDPNQVTSDHGWDLDKHRAALTPIVRRLTAAGIRVSLFVDYDCKDMQIARELGARRVELYTEPYAQAFGTSGQQAMLDAFRTATARAQAAGLEVNAGHDLNLQNLAPFLTIPGIKEVSIGHALIVEALYQGIDPVIKKYVSIAGGGK
jgi:pyridoxine 5-phosphate synthase